MAFGAACLEGTATHAAEAVAGTAAKAGLVLRRLVCIALEDTEANPRRRGRKGPKEVEAARLARRSAPPELRGSAALGGQRSAATEATAQSGGTSMAATRTLVPEDVAFLTDWGDEGRPVLTQS